MNATTRNKTKVFNADSRNVEIKLTRKGALKVYIYPVDSREPLANATVYSPMTNFIFENIDKHALERLIRNELPIADRTAMKGILVQLSLIATAIQWPIKAKVKFVTLGYDAAFLLYQGRIVGNASRGIFSIGPSCRGTFEPLAPYNLYPANKCLEVLTAVLDDALKLHGNLNAALGISPAHAKAKEPAFDSGIAKTIQALGDATFNAKPHQQQLSEDRAALALIDDSLTTMKLKHASLRNIVESAILVGEPISADVVRQQLKLLLAY